MTARGRAGNIWDDPEVRRWLDVMPLDVWRVLPRATRPELLPVPRPKRFAGLLLVEEGSEQREDG